MKKTKWAGFLGILAAVLFLLLSFSVAAPRAEALVLTLSDQELATQFSINFGSANLTITDLVGPGVEFSLTNIGLYYGSYKVGLSDNYPVSPLAGGTGSHNADFTAYSSYSLLFHNTGSTDVSVGLFMNTGFTGTSGQPGADTFWGGPWVTVSAGQTVRAGLDFSYAETWGAGDDPVESWRYTDGTWNSIFRLEQVTNIGFQLIPASGTEAKIEVSAAPVPLPGALWLFGSGLAGLWGWRRRFS